MTNEEMQKKIEELEFRLNEFSKPDYYSFPRTLITRVGSKLGFYGVTPVVRPSSTGETTGASAADVQNTTTFNCNYGTTAYTILDIVKHLKNLGILSK